MHDDAQLRQRAERLLHALQCHCAATAMLDVATAAALPGPTAEQELMRAVIAIRPPVLPAADRWPAGVAARLPDGIAASDVPLHRRATALAAALFAVEHPMIAQDEARLAALANADDAQTARFAALASERMRIAGRLWLQQPLTEVTPEQLSVLRALDDDTVAALPIERLREALALAAPTERTVPAKPPTSTASDLGTRILENARKSPDVLEQVRSRSAGEFVAIVATRNPRLVLAAELTPAEARTMAISLLSHPPVPPALLTSSSA